MAHLVEIGPGLYQLQMGGWEDTLSEAFLVEGERAARLRHYHEERLARLCGRARDGFCLEEELWASYYEQMAAGMAAYFRRQALG